MSDEVLLPELFDYIIDFLHDDQVTLRACSLVCWSWVASSRIHLFHHLNLTGSPQSGACLGWGPNTGCRRLHGTLASSPHLAGYISKISIKEKDIKQPPNYRWVAGEIMFPSLLKQLRSLEELEFDFPVPLSHENKTVWATMVFNDILDAMKTLTLKSFTLRQFAFTSLADFIKIMESWRNLQILQLDDVDIVTEAQLSTSALEHALDVHIPVLWQAPGYVEKANIHHLLLRSTKSALLISTLLHAHSPLSLSKLTTLTINVTSDNYANVLGLLKCALILETLKIEVETSFDYEAVLDSTGILDLNGHRLLNKLALQIGLGQIEPMSWIIPLFGSVSAENYLSDISIVCSIGERSPAQTADEHNNTLAKWKTFDDLLSGPTFSSLKAFRLEFTLESPFHDQGHQTILNEYVKQLSNLSDRFILDDSVSFGTSA